MRRGDRILLMLGNVVPLWEVMLAAMKLGAVVIPATTLLTPDDLADRFGRGRARHVIAGSAEAAKFADLAEGITRIAVGPPVAGWHAYDALAGSAGDLRRRRARPAPTTRCCSISRPAPPRGPSSCCTATRAIRSAT